MNINRCPACGHCFHREKKKTEREEKIISLLENGKTIDEISEELKISISTVRRFLYKNHISQKGTFLDKENKETAYKRSEEIVSLYLKGETYKEIGNAFGISRERVRQILKLKEIDLDIGGRFIRTLLKASELSSIKKEKERSKEIRVFEKWGLNLEEYSLLAEKYGTASNEQSPFRKYMTQRSNSRKRGIEWTITFKDWWDIWEKSGKYHLRGRGSNYVMGRLGDDGPYSKENIYICTGVENAKDQYKSGKERKKPIRKKKESS